MRSKHCITPTKVIPHKYNTVTTNLPIERCVGAGGEGISDGGVVLADNRLTASRLANSTLAISVATHSGKSGIAHVTRRRKINIAC